MDNLKEISDVIERGRFTETKNTWFLSNVDKLEKDKPPKGTFYLVHVLCMFMVSLLPLTFFVTANDYWMYKFRDTKKDVIDLTNKTTLQKYFVSGCMVVQTVPSVVTMMLAAAFGHRIKVNLRIIGTLSFICSIFIIFTIFIKVNTDTWQMQFFIITLIGLSLITGVLNLLQVSFIAVVPRFPQIYMKTFLFGKGMAPIFGAVLQMISLALGTSTFTSALVYFISGTFVTMFTLFFYITIQKTAFYSFYVKKKLEDTKKKHSKEEIKTVFVQIWPCVAMLTIIFLTLSVTHPCITTLVVSENYNKGSKWNDVYFVPIITFFFTEMCSQFGRLLSRPLITKTNGPWLVGLVTLRMLVLVPLVFLCNAQPRRHLPVLLPHDWQYILLCIVYFSSGSFIPNSIFLSIQKLTDKEDIAFLIMISFLSVCAGLFSPLSLLAVRIL